MYIEFMNGKGSEKMAHIKKWYPKDERFFKELAASGNIRDIDANRIDISDTRLKNMIKDHLIKEVSYVNPKHNEVESCKSYCFTNKGKQFISEKYGINRTQSPAAIKHNCKVAETICSLQKKEIDTIKPEWEVRNQMKEAIENLREQGELDRYDEYMSMMREQQLSAVDFIYVNMQGIECGIEITTNNYSENDIAGKEICSEIINIPVSYVSV